MTHLEEFLKYIKAIKKSKPSNDIRKQIFLKNICNDYKKKYKQYIDRYTNSKGYSYKEEMNFYKNVIPPKVLQEINSYNITDHYKLMGLRDLFYKYMDSVSYICTNKSKSNSKSKSVSGSSHKKIKN